MTSTKDTKGQDEATLRFLRQSFSQYYSKAKLLLPDRFGRREWGFMFFGRDMMLRHMALRSSDEMRAFLRREAPAHSYHSTAYYEKPDAQTMKDKKWLGADLIFDLDADHIEGSAAMGYEQMLSVVKREIIRLAEEFILGDLGFDADHIHLVFSGGRGYHIHVTDPSVLELDSRERREIVDYITGVGLNLELQKMDPTSSVTEESYKTREVMEIPQKSSFYDTQSSKAKILRVFVFNTGTGWGQFKRADRQIRLPPMDAPGWEGRIARTTPQILDELEKLDKKSAIKKMTILGGLGNDNASKMYDELFNVRTSGITGANIIRQGKTVDIFSKEQLLLKFFEFVKETAGVKIEKKKPDRIFDVRSTGETDEPVTSDIKRLIRLPTSLHGKTGFCVVPLSIDEVKTFDPLKDAVVLPDAPVKVVVKRALQVRLLGQDFRLEPGPTELPGYAAVFAMGRGAAILAPASSEKSIG